MKRIYCAGPIGKQSIQEANEWRDRVEKYFAGLDIRNPLRGKEESKRSQYSDAEIVFRDKNDIKNADLILVYWPEKTISNGTAMEIIYAWSNEVPVIFVGDWAKEDIWLRYHTTHFCSDLEEALRYIEQMWL